ncbi:MAG: hypothetical protein JST23_03580 [Bacteroidetes bacterium]|nr:hypothetical protein [Bacteroidota bacterium]
MLSFKLDRSAFKAQSTTDAAKHAQYYKTLTWQERLKITAYLNSIAYNYPLNSPPKLDRTKFSVKSRVK